MAGSSNRNSQRPTDAEALPSAPSGHSRPIVVHGRRLALRTVMVCLGIEILFVVLDYALNYADREGFGMIRRMFNMAREDGIASWFAATQTWMVGLTAGVLLMAARRGGRSGVALGWAVVTFFFLYMAMDDGAEIHERLGSAFEEAHPAPAAGAAASLGARMLQSFPSYAWQITVLPLFAGLGLFTLLFLWRQAGQAGGRALLLAGFACFAIAVGLDFIEGLEESHPWNPYRALIDRAPSPRDLDIYTLKRFGEYAFDTVQHFAKSLEEFLEMLGNTLLWAALLGHLAATAGDLTFRFLPSGRAADRRSAKSEPPRRGAD